MERRHRVAIDVRDGGDHVRRGDPPMIDEQEMDDDAPALRRAWTKLAGRIVRMRSDLVVVLLDMVLAVSAFAGMFLLRYDASVPDRGWSEFATFAPIAMLAVVVANLVWGLY